MLTLILMTILGSVLALGALYVGMMLFGYLLLAIGRWQMFEKMGQPGWKGFIPIYSDYVLYGVAGFAPVHVSENVYDIPGCNHIVPTLHERRIHLLYGLKRSVVKSQDICVTVMPVCNIVSLRH